LFHVRVLIEKAGVLLIMQQWVCHIQGLDDLVSAREVEKLGRQINGVNELRVDYAGETISVSATSSDVYFQLEKTLAKLGYKLLKKGYIVTSVIHIPDLEADYAMEVVRRTIGKHTLVQKLDIRPLSKLVYLTHSVDYSITRLICALNNQKVSAYLKGQVARKRTWQKIQTPLVILSSVAFFIGLYYQLYVGKTAFAHFFLLSSISVSAVFLTKRIVRQIMLTHRLCYELILLAVMLFALTHNLWLESALLGLSWSLLLLYENKIYAGLKQDWNYFKSLIPTFSFVNVAESSKSVPVSEIKVGDSITVLPGYSVPVDSEVVHGSGIVNLENLVDESIPVSVKSGDKVYAGMFLKEGELVLRSLKNAEDSVYNQIFSSLENTQMQYSTAQNKFNIMALVLFYLSIVIGFALILYEYFSPYIGVSGVWFEKAFALLVICGSTFAVSSLHFSYVLSNIYAAKKGIFCFQLNFWQKLANISALSLDKEGVLTKRQEMVQEVISLSDASTQDVLILATGLLQSCSSDRFNAILNRANESGITINESAKIQEQNSEMVLGTLNEATVCVGTQAAMEQLGFLTDDLSDRVKRWQSEGESLFLVSKDNAIIGMITVVDTYYDQVGEFVESWHRLSKNKITLLSKDNVYASENIANRYGIDNVVANVSNENNATVLQELSHESNLLHVTDSLLLSPTESRDLIMFNNSFSDDKYSIKNAMLSISNNLLNLVSVMRVAKQLQFRQHRMVTVFIVVKLLLLTVILLTSWVPLEFVIISDLVLNLAILSSTYQPRQKNAEV